jgi:hypothetical protein
MTTVTARKIRDHGPPGGSASPAQIGTGVGRVYRGFLVGYPVVGRGMVIFRDPNGHRMVTTPVRRILSDGGDAEGRRETLYVETDNSVYRLTFEALPQRQKAA